MEINFTLFIQAAIYLALLLILKRLYFEPLLALLDKRNQLTVGKLGEAGDFLIKVEALSAQYESAMKEAREGVEAHRHEAIQKSRAISQEKIHDAKAKFEKKLADYQAILERDAQQIKAKFPALALELKKEVSAAVLNSRVVRI